jgi:hypothetical protein
MFRFRVRFPISDGKVVSVLKAALSGWSGLSGGGKLPAIMTKRVFTVRNDSGPQELSRASRRYGINVWADSSVDAENLALDAMEGLTALADGSPLLSVGSFTGPFEVNDDPAYTFGSTSMTHFYFAFQGTVKGS